MSESSSSWQDFEDGYVPRRQANSPQRSAVEFWIKGGSSVQPIPALGGRVPPSLTTDIFVPKLRVVGDETAHHLDAFRQIEIDHFHTVTAHEIRRAGKRPALAYDNLADAELHNRAATEIAGHERGIKNCVAKTPEPPGVAQAIDFRVRDRIALLHAFVMAGGEQFSRPRERGANGNSTLAQTLLRLRDRERHQFVFRHF